MKSSTEINFDYELESDNRYELDSNVSCVSDKVLSKFRFIAVDKKQSIRKKSTQKQKDKLCLITK
jgi:hypothetical protein